MKKGKTTMARKAFRLCLGFEEKTSGDKVTITRTYPIKDLTGAKPVRGIHYHE